MSHLKQILREITPPVIRKTARRMSSRRPAPVNQDIVLNKSGPMSLACYIGEPVFSVPLAKVRYFGGLPFDYDNHHFLQYYRDGISALNSYYQNHQPETIFERHFLRTPEHYDSQNIVEDSSTFHLSLPWLFNQGQEVHNGEKGLGPEHGNQICGPVSDRKIRLEAARLDAILKSIRKFGFKPELFQGHPRGYFLIDDEGEWVFLIREGMHRMAALAHLDYKTVPVRFKEHYPRVVKQSECPEWPMVRNGYLSEDEALDIFSQYIEREPVSVKTCSRVVQRDLSNFG